MLLHFKAVEALAIHTDNGTLRDKSVGIHLVDELKNQCALALLTQNEKHLHIVTAVEAMTVDNGAATVYHLVNAVANVLVFLRNDEEPRKEGVCFRKKELMRL